MQLLVGSAGCAVWRMVLEGRQVVVVLLQVGGVGREVVLVSVKVGLCFCLRDIDTHLL